MRQGQDNTVRNFFNSEDKIFLQACDMAGIQPTKRQASKWLSKKGLAYKTYHSVIYSR